MINKIIERDPSVREDMTHKGTPSAHQFKSGGMNDDGHYRYELIS